MTEGNEDTAFELEYVTSAVNMLAGEAIVVHVVNDSGVAEHARVVISRNSGAGAITVTDTGSMNVGATWTGGTSLGISEPGEYWLRVQTTSEALIPKASFERVESAVWRPFVTYRPGDFAVFSLTRKRIW